MRQPSSRGLLQPVACPATRRVRNEPGEDGQTGCSDDALGWRLRFCRTRETCRKIGEGNHEELTAPVAFHDHAPLFEASRESAAYATHVLAALSVDRFVHVKPTGDV